MEFKPTWYSLDHRIVSPNSSTQSKKTSKTSLDQGGPTLTAITVCWPNSPRDRNAKIISSNVLNVATNYFLVLSQVAGEACRGKGSG